jgi:hypothetical protein
MQKITSQFRSINIMLKIKATPFFVTTALAAGVNLTVVAQEVSSYAVSTEVKLSSDYRNRAISDSLNKPSLKMGLQLAHESGLAGLIEVATVSKKQFLDGNGLALTLGGGYRAGDPDGFHYGVGLAAELFPGAKFEAPQSFDFNTFTPTDLRRSNFNSTFALIELGYGNFDLRLLNAISKDYRGINTGSVCGTLLLKLADPTIGLDCYARGTKSSKGTWLLDASYKHELTADTTLILHAGYQKVPNFKEVNFADYSVAIAHKRWGFNWSVEWLTARTKNRELFQVTDGQKNIATDKSKLIFSVAKTF